MNINIIAKKGVIIDNKEILLGGSIQDMLKKFPEYDKWDDMYYFFDANLALYVKNNIIEEIEVRNSGDDSVKVFCEGIDVFQKEKEMVLSYFERTYGDLLKKDSTDFVVEKAGIEFAFGISEEGVKECIQEAKKDGIYEEMRETIEKDIYRSKHVETFLIRRLEK